MSGIPIPTHKTLIGCAGGTGDTLASGRVRITEAAFKGSRLRPNFFGVRTTEAEIFANSTGASCQRHFFSLRVLHAEGTDAPASGLPTRRKGRNLYRRSACRMPWANDVARR
ncbi:MAG: hypothetical protein OXL68_01220 [Paracoccaceae bacterium]|nr:hypothetical protein [Paracoccaceae bacterium]